MNRVAEIVKWQNDLQAAPKVWLVYVSSEGENEHTGNVYESKEAAQLEVDFILKHRPRQRPKIHCVSIHSFELSQRRWSGFTP